MQHIIIIITLDNVICFIKYIMKFKCQTRYSSNSLPNENVFRVNIEHSCCYWVLGGVTLPSYQKELQQETKKYEEALPWSHVVNALL